MICNVGDPIVAVDVGYVEDVECVDAEPDVAEDASCSCVEVAIVVVEQSVAYAEVYAAVAWHAEDLFFAACVGGTEGQSACIVCLHGDFPSVGVGKVVAEEE